MSTGKSIVIGGIAAILLFAALGSLDTEPAPIATPTAVAAIEPTVAPTATPTVAPTVVPTPRPTLRPTPVPTPVPTPDESLLELAWMIHMIESLPVAMQIMEDISTASDNFDLVGLIDLGDTLHLWAEGERAWLRDNPAPSCFANIEPLYLLAVTRFSESGALLADFELEASLAKTQEATSALTQLNTMLELSGCG